MASTIEMSNLGVATTAVCHNASRPGACAYAEFPWHLTVTKNQAVRLFRVLKNLTGADYPLSGKTGTGTQ